MGRTRGMVRRYEATLSTTEALVLAMAHHVNVRRFPLTFPSLSADPQRLIKIGLIVSEDLEKRGLSRRGRLNPDLVRSFALVADYTISIGVSGIDPTGENFFILGLTDHRHQLVIVQRGDELTFDLDDGDDLPAKIAPLFDYGWAKPRAAVMRAPITDLTAGQDHERDQGGGQILEMVRAPERGFENAHYRMSHAEAITTIPTYERLGGGFIVIDGRTRAGAIVHADPLSWMDTEIGRFLVTTAYDDYDTGEVVFTPADAGVLTRVLHEHSPAPWRRAT